MKFRSAPCHLRYTIITFPLYFIDAAHVDRNFFSSRDFENSAGREIARNYSRVFKRETHTLITLIGRNMAVGFAAAHTFAKRIHISTRHASSSAVF